MYIIIDDRNIVAGGYATGFHREGISSTGIEAAEFREWIVDPPRLDRAPRPYQIHILQLVEARPEVIAVEHGSQVRMRRRTRHIEESRQRRDERRCAYEFDPERQVELPDNLPGLMHVVRARFVVVRQDFLRGKRGRVNVP